MSTKESFVRPQGFADAPQTCTSRYPALMWQPRVIGILVLIGLVLQPAPYFLALSALLWWNALLPQLNPFDALYNRLVARPKGLLQLGSAPDRAGFRRAWRERSCSRSGCCFSPARTRWRGSSRDCWSLRSPR